MSNKLRKEVELVLGDYERALLEDSLERIQDWTEWFYFAFYLSEAGGGGTFCPDSKLWKQELSAFRQDSPFLFAQCKNKTFKESLVDPMFQYEIQRFLKEQKLKVVSCAIGLYDAEQDGLRIVSESKRYGGEKLEWMGQPNETVFSILESMPSEFWKIPQLIDPSQDHPSDSSERLSHIWSYPLHSDDGTWLGCIAFCSFEPGFEFMLGFSNQLFFKELESQKPFQRIVDNVSTISKITKPLAGKLIGLVADAYWKRNARSVMHELGNTLSDPWVFFEPVRNSLNRSYRKLHQINGRYLDSVDTQSKDDFQYCLAEIDACLSSMTGFETRLNRMQSKLDWYYQLTDPTRKGKDGVLHTLGTIVDNACQEMVRKSFETGNHSYRLEDSEDPVWSLRFGAPQLFLEFCFEALLSNAFFHRKEDSIVSVSAAFATEGNEVIVRWKNHANKDDMERISELLRNPEYSQGMRVAHSIAEGSLGGTLQVDMSDETVTTCLRIPRCQGSNNCFFELGKINTNS